MTTELRCPACGSLARPDAGWCSLCHADLRTEEEKAAARQVQEWATVATGTAPDTDWAAEFAALAAGPADTVPPAGISVTGPDRLSVVPGDPAPPAAPTELAGRGRHARSDPAGTALPAADAPAPASPVTGGSSEADLVLAKAGIDIGGMLELLAANEPPPLGQLSGRLTTKGQRAIAILVAAATLTAAGLLVMFVLGLFVH